MNLTEMDRICTILTSLYSLKRHFGGTLFLAIFHLIKGGLRRNMKVNIFRIRIQNCFKKTPPPLIFLKTTFEKYQPFSHT